ncbi:MAG: MFS transporter [Desulfuromonadaceae bacterium]|nr:MFS transporter [Desulfuromonadaceae bacterium]MDD5106696.1 MFS transporter [Desulfuromonadaceae bacterium]
MIIPVLNKRRRWIIFSTLALMYILVYFYRVSLALVAGDISLELHLTPEQLGTLSGVMFFVYGAAQLPLGPMIDRIGSRLVISGCGVLTTCGGILFSQADTFALAMVARVLIGIGTASVLMATFTLFSHWFSAKEFGKVSGFMVALGNLGNLAATAPLAFAVESCGWRYSFLVVGGAQALVTVLVFCIVQDKPAGKPFQEEGDVGARTGMISAWKEIFGARDFWLLGIIAFSWYGTYLALQALWGGPYLMEVLHLPREKAGSMLMFTSLGFIVGSSMIDTVARRVFGSYKKTLLAGQTVLLIFMSAFFGWAEAIPQALLSAVFFIIGMAVSSGVMIYPIIRSMFRVNIVGTALTSLNFYVLMGAAVTQQVMGIIVGSYGGAAGSISSQALHSAFLFPVAALAFSIILFSRAGEYGRLG